MWQIEGYKVLLGLPGVFDVEYDGCMLGGLRLKRQKLRTNIKSLAKLALKCDGSHDHLPWSSVSAGGIYYHTQDEAQYTFECCDAVVHEVMNELRSTSLAIL